MQPNTQGGTPQLTKDEPKSAPASEKLNRFKRRILIILGVAIVLLGILIVGLIAGLYLFGWITPPVKTITNILPLPAFKVDGQTVTARAVFDEIQGDTPKSTMTRLINEVYISNYAREKGLTVTDEEILEANQTIQDRDRARRFVLIAKVQSNLQNNPELLAQAKLRAETALAELKTSGDFEAVARKYSGHIDQDILKNSVNPILLDTFRVPSATSMNKTDQLPPIPAEVAKLKVNDYIEQPLMVGSTYYLVQRVSDDSLKQPRVRLVRVYYGFDDWLATAKEQLPPKIYLSKVIDR